MNPDSNALLLEAADSIGGVWAKHRHYKGLKSNNMLGTYEYSDFPMDEATFGVKPGEHIPGETVQRYLEAYAERFGFTDCIRLGHRVESAQHNLDGTWQLKVSHGSEMATVETKKLIVATDAGAEVCIAQFNERIFNSTTLDEDATVENSSITAFAPTRVRERRNSSGSVAQCQK